MKAVTGVWRRELWAVLAALGALSVSGCGSGKPPGPARTAAQAGKEAPPATVSLDAAAQKSSGVVVEVAALRSLPQIIRSTARMTNNEENTWRVGALTEGRIVRVLVNPGDMVRQGQVLARMHSHDIHEARAEYRKATTEMVRLQASLAFATRVRDRARRLYELKAGSLEQWEHAETELRNADAALANAKIEVERTRRHLVEYLGIAAEGIEEHKEGEGYHEDDYIPVKSPATGTLLLRNVTPGAVVAPTNDLFVVSDLSSLWAMAEVGEEHLSKLRAGMPVKVFVQAYGDEAFPGRIGKIGETLDPATRTVKVRVEVPNRAGRLKPEMYATTEIELGRSENAVFVPEEAIQEVRGQMVVFVEAAPGRFEVHPVQVGRPLEGSIEIVRGLRPGDRVVTRGSFVLKSEFLKSSMAEE
jgi:cobalt-zinc-cadmium efflux system membrane fusion protein